MVSREERLQKQEQLRQLRDEVERELKQIPGVVGVGIGFKMTDGQLVEEIVFQVFVEEKKSLDEIPPEQMIPRQIRGIPTDVMTVLRASVQADPTPGDLQKKRRPLAAGIQIQNNKKITSTSGQTTTIQTSAGTLGCFARRSGDNTGTYVLSNEHVMLALGASVGDKLAQDEYVDCICCDCNVIGIITAAVNNNVVDCAIAKLESDIAIVNEIVGIGTIQGTTPQSSLAAGDPVRKVGRTTGLTSGTIFSVSAPVINDGKTYNNQIIIAPSSGRFSDHGDSGSVVINAAARIIGLLFAGDDNSPFHTVANPIEAVTVALNITVISGSGGGSRALITRGEEVMPVRRLQAKHPLPELEGKLEQSATGRKVLALVRRHFDEVAMLVNSRRPVTLVWRRKQGPAFLAAVLRNAKVPAYKIPDEIEGVSRQNMLMSLIPILEDHASPALKRDLRQYGLAVIAAATHTDDLDAFVAGLSAALAQPEHRSEPVKALELYSTMPG